MDIMIDVEGPILTKQRFSGCVDLDFMRTVDIWGKSGERQEWLLVTMYISSHEKIILSVNRLYQFLPDRSPAKVSSRI